MRKNESTLFSKHEAIKLKWLAGLGVSGSRKELHDPNRVKKTLSMLFILKIWPFPINLRNPTNFATSQNRNELRFLNSV